MIFQSHLSNTLTEAQTWIDAYLKDYPYAGYGTTYEINKIKVPFIDNEGLTIQVTKWEVKVERFDSCD